ncbi:transcriptional repressor [Candidatus Kaiserbacteria bacterium]|nr:transcriptional repressor [Candidatus Kaiserbacteria bacterium]
MGHGYKYYKGSDRKVLQAVLRDKDFYSTEGRLQLLSFLKKASAPVSVPEVTKQIGKNLVEANVYRALEALADAGVLARSDIRRGGAHYEYPHSHHHHIVCSNCGHTEEVEDCGGKSMERRAFRNSESFAEVRTHALEFFGLCRACAHAR